MRHGGDQAFSQPASATATEGSRSAAGGVLRGRYHRLSGAHGGQLQPYPNSLVFPVVVVCWCGVHYRSWTESVFWNQEKMS